MICSIIRSPEDYTEHVEVLKKQNEALAEENEYLKAMLGKATVTEIIARYGRSLHLYVDAMQEEAHFYKKRICEFCGVTCDDSRYPDSCEIAGHGEWIEQKSGLTYFKNCACSICGHTRVFKPEEVPKFCEECGSKMAPVIVERKEEKE